MWAMTGMTGSQLPSLLSLAAWLPWLAGLFIWSSSAAAAKKMLSARNSSTSAIASTNESPSLNPRSTSVSARILGAALGMVGPRSRLSEATGILVIAACSFAMGYMYRDYRQHQNTYTMFDVRVLRRDATNMYLLASAFRGPFESVWCADYTPEWEPGSTLKVLVYEDRGECKSLSGPKLGYTVLRDGEGHPVLTQIKEMMR